MSLTPLGEPSTCIESCGNYYTTKNEQCDDGNRAGGDGCDNNCRIEAGWVCYLNPSSCTKCGNGQAQAPEECDDYNTAAGDGCSSNCTIELGMI